ncbi:MAG: hypothetical protein IH591_00210 [Bacteroidales bacterium]|nr:hypothetical protein [Bacteroidales bacterium]
MELNERTMTSEESLRIISDMINKTKSNMSQSSFHLLFWGWLIMACSLSEYFLYNFTNFANPWYVWLFVIPGVVVSLTYGFVKGRKERVFTYADMLNMWTWIGFMIAAVILFVLLSDRLESVAPFILLLAGFPTFISGFIIKFRPLVFGGLSFWIISIIANFAGPHVASLSVPLAIITGYLIPGYLLRIRSSHEAV